MDKHYNPVIFNRLQCLVEQRDWQGILVYLNWLTHAHFRTAGYILGERLLPMLGEADAWALVSILVAYDAKAFLVTMLKTVAERLKSGTLHLRSHGARVFWEQLRAGNKVLSGIAVPLPLTEQAQESGTTTDVNIQKALSRLLPAMTKYEDVQWLFRKFGVEEGEKRIPYLLRTPTQPVAYALFHTVKFVDHDRSLLIRIVHFLMKQNDGLSFNLASLLKTYYGLDEVKGTFSLRIEPYQLARIERSYSAFCQLVKF